MFLYLNLKNKGIGVVIFLIFFFLVLDMFEKNVLFFRLLIVYIYPGLDGFAVSALSPLKTD